MKITNLILIASLTVVLGLACMVVYILPLAFLFLLVNYANTWVGVPEDAVQVLLSLMAVSWFFCYAGLIAFIVMYNAELLDAKREKE